jgi:hypothetical protein
MMIKKNTCCWDNCHKEIPYGAIFCFKHYWYFAPALVWEILKINWKNYKNYMDRIFKGKNNG